MLERNLTGKSKYVSSRDFDKLRVTAVALLPNHLPFGAKLFVPAKAEITAAATYQIMHAHAVAWPDAIDIFTHDLYLTCHFVSESDRQRIYRRDTGAIVRVGVTDSAGGYTDQNFRRPDLWNGDFGIFQLFAELHESHRSH
jgi:hypothetical protein